MRQELEKPDGTIDQDASMGLRGLRRTRERRYAAALASLAEITGQQGPLREINRALLDFLADEISEQMMQELVRSWTVSRMGHPTLPKLTQLAETIHLQTAVAALDR